MLRKFLISAFLLFAGVAAGFLILTVFARTLRFDHPLLARFGIRKPEIIGFMPYWLLDKADKDYGNYITTLAYFGLTIDADGKPVYLATPQEEDPGWTALKGEAWQDQKERAGDVKLSLLVHSADDGVITQLLEDPEAKAQALVTELAPLMEKRGFTDLNLDIESFAEASDEARLRFTRFVEAVVDTAKMQGIRTVTVEIPPIALFVQNIADPVAIGKAADRVVVMTYDYHYSGSFLSGPVAPVGGAGSEREFDVTMAIEEAVRQIPSEKIILGIPLYGYEWETISAQPGVATIPSSTSTASSRRIADFLSSCATCSASRNTVSGQPYIVWQDEDHFQQVFYEDEESLRQKITLAQTYRLGGVAVWALGYEDDVLLGPLSTYKRGYRLPFPVRRGSADSER